MDNLKKIDIKKYIPGALLVLLTIFLMIYFKFGFKGLDNLLDSGKENIESFITDNLRPLFYNTQLTNEDVFNFALFSNLPVNKETNEIVKIEDAGEGKETLTIQKADLKENTNNYESFKELAKLNENQKIKLDSIINSHKTNLYSAVFVDNKEKSYAIDKKLPDIRKAIIADIYAFAENIKKESSNAVFTSYDTNINRLNNFVSTVNKDKVSSFLVFGKDTVFSTSCEVDKDAIKTAIKVAEISGINVDSKLPSGIKQASGVSSFNNGYSYKIDSNFYSATYPAMAATVSNTVNSNVAKYVDSLSAVFKDFTVNIRVNPGNQSIAIAGANGSAGTVPAFEVNVKDIDSMVSASVKMASFYSQAFGSNWQNLGFEIDTSGNSFGFYFNDSTFEAKMKNLDIKAEEFEKEMKKLKINLKSKIRNKEK